jgi:hypothetical protein
VAQFDFTPMADLQIAIWIEDPQGNYVDTVYVTRATGTYGLGNRPGRWDFNSAFLWPYGRRDGVLPIWAHRRGITYPQLVYQDNDDNDLSHPLEQSSPEPFYCRPLQVGENTWQASIDSGTCATNAYSDKGRFSASERSYYPPRNDLSASPSASDSDDVRSYATLNDLDAVSHATPPANMPFSLLWAPPPGLGAGSYVAFIEVSQENDFNATYNPMVYPAPADISWSVYGQPYRGQPSVIYRLPFEIGGASTVYQTADYAGYGPMDGLSATLNPPDATITTVATPYTVPAGPGGTPPAREVTSLGAARLGIETSPQGDYKVRIEFASQDDTDPPGAPMQLSTVSVSGTEAALALEAPGDDGQSGQATAYDIRYRAGAPLDASNFVSDGIPLGTVVRPVMPGQSQTFTVGGLFPETHYWVGIRAVDDCLNYGPITFVEVQTPRAENLEVDACFVATAAWGSLMEAHVGALRRFRDRWLRSQILGELFVEAYYTFGPALAQVIRPSTTLRGVARQGLGPFVDFARSVTDVPEASSR